MRKCISLLVVVLLNVNIVAAGDNKGMCPPATAKPKTVPIQSKPDQNDSPSPGSAFAGSVSLFTVISDRGYVCSVELLRGFDKSADAEAMRATRQRRFVPAQRDGRAFPVGAVVEVTFWRDASGQLVQGSQTSKATK